MTTMRILAVAALAAALPLSAQTRADTGATVIQAGRAGGDSAAAAPKPKAPRYIAPAAEIQYIRHVDARGLNVFEAPKVAGAEYTGLRISWGGAFTQQFQNLTHENTAAPKLSGVVNQNQLIAIGSGFNNAVANLYLNVQVARGVRVAVETYASARHHQETWVKDGYFLIDESPIENPLLDRLMKYTTLKVGHFEVNYGDQHFRRSDNGNALYNPFVGNFIMDAFTTEIGAEAYLRRDGWLAMAGVTGGEVHGQVTAPGQRGPSFLLKAGVDKQPLEKVRVRLTGSMYKTDRSASNTLFSGDRAGSRYYDVLENTASSETANAWSGNVRTGMGNMVTAFVVNPFVKVGGVELFGNVETVTGAAASETERRTVRQLVGEGLYRFAGEKLYLGGRYNTVKGTLAGITNDITVNRTQLGGGWFVTPNVLAKMELVEQKYLDFPATDIRNGGQFRGFMVEGVVAF